MSRYVNHVLTDKSVVVVFDDKMIPVDVANPMYKTVKNLCTRNKYNELDDALDVASSIKKHSSGKFYVQDGVVFAEGGPMPSALSTRVLGFADAGLDCEPLIKFWDNLKQNPNEFARNETFLFLEANHVPITEDGCFVGYKKIGADFKDLYTHTLDNNVGQVVKMDRNKVDPNRQNTCSTGLHVAAFDYAAHQYGSSVDVLVLVKVNPKDVVSVPPDYNQQKMRVCEYTVLEVFQGDKPLTEEVWGGGVTPSVTEDDVNEDADTDLDSDFDDDDDDDFEDEEEDDDYDDDEDDLDEPEADLVTGVSADKQGRVCLPNSHIKHMGLGVGDTAYVTVEKGFVFVSPTSMGGDSLRTYTVDRDCNVRLSASAFKDAGLNKTNFTCRTWEDQAEVS